MKSQRRKFAERLTAFLTLLLATALMTYAATSSAAAPVARPARAASVAPRTALSAAPELLVTIDTKNTPVKRDARAADEPLSRPAVSAARKLSTDDAPRYHTIRMEVTAYCACRECCGPNARGITASGQPVSFNRGKFVAADTSLLPFGTKLIIPGYNKSRPVPVADRGGAIVGRHIDLFFPTHQQAMQWGRQVVDVTVVD